MLTSAYAMSTDKTADVLRHLLDRPAFNLESPHAVEHALQASIGGLEFPDALHWALSHHCQGIATFDDHGFARKARRMKLHPPVVIPDAEYGD